MIWQDWVFSIGSWIFVIALIPTIRGGSKPALSTSLLTGSILAIFAITYFSLELWLSTVSTIATATSWYILAWQKYNSDHKKHDKG